MAKINLFTKLYTTDGVLKKSQCPACGSVLNPPGGILDIGRFLMASIDTVNTQRCKDIGVDYSGLCSIAFDLRDKYKKKEELKLSINQSRDLLKVIAEHTVPSLYDQVECIFETGDNKYKVFDDEENLDEPEEKSESTDDKQD